MSIGRHFAGWNKLWWTSLIKEKPAAPNGRHLPVPSLANGVYLIGVTPDNSLLLGTWEGIYKSTDWDSTWTNVYVDHSGVCAVTALLKLNNGTMLATVFDHIGMGMGGVLQSTDNGDTWENIGLLTNVQSLFGKKFPRRDLCGLSCLISDSSTRLIKSTDYGETWQEFLLHQCVQGITLIIMM